MHERAALVALAALAIGGCRGEPTAGDVTPPADAAPQPERRPTPAYFGRIVPRKATPVHAPPAIFRLKSWNNRSNWIKIMDLVADGAKVEKGQEVARFEFTSEEALPWIKERIAEARANLESSRVEVGENGRSQRTKVEVLRLDAERAALDTQKEGLVSDRDLALLELAAERARVERDMQARMLGANEAKGRTEVRYLEETAREWERGLDTYAFYERRAHVLAPTAGVVRYAYLNNVRRKVQKADNMPSGTPFALIAEDERLSVEVLVPEHAIGGYALGVKLAVRLPDAAERFQSAVREIAPFPQEIGFLRGDDDLPDAREKVFVVTADFDEAPASLKSGIEVRVGPW
jgi:multidrug efflux pump subunit AcrA (membrane-fusion protein)